MTALVLLEAAGRRRSPATCPATTPAAFLATRVGAIRPTRRQWRRSSPSCAAQATTCMAFRTRALVVLLWRSGLRICEAFALAESDLDRSRGAVPVRHSKGGKRREVGMDP